MPVLVVVVAEVVPLVLVPVLQMVQEAVAQATLHLARPHRRGINNGMVTMKADSDFAAAIRHPNRIAYQRQVSDKANYLFTSLPLSF